MQTTLLYLPSKLLVEAVGREDELALRAYVLMALTSGLE
jgi:hypothetical protein